MTQQEKTQEGNRDSNGLPLERKSPLSNPGGWGTRKFGGDESLTQGSKESKESNRVDSSSQLTAMRLKGL